MLILGSGSIRRKELLESAKLTFKVVSPQFDERSLNLNQDPIQFAMLSAQNKAYSIKDMYPNDTILCADTIVAYNTQILGKPQDEADAFKMLKFLSGKRHQVITGCCIINGDKETTFYEVSYVTFKKLHNQMIKAYVETKEPLDKSGSYAIQGGAKDFILKYEGDLHNIIGLPLKKVLAVLNQYL